MGDHRLTVIWYLDCENVWGKVFNHGKQTNETMAAILTVFIYKINILSGGHGGDKMAS
jgi:hypothetical protein